MKTALALSLILTTGFIFAQVAQVNNFTPGYSSHPTPPPRDGKIPPPLNLGAAYDKAILKLGQDTNQFHCVSANCSQRLDHIASAQDPSGSSFGWTLVFMDTNGVQKNVCVYFDMAATVWVEDPANAGR